MRARGHLTGGAISAWATATCASTFELIPGITHPLWWGIAATALFFSLFPDVDTDSVPRRWFYRGILLVLLYLGWVGAWIDATVVAAVAMLPLVDHHRGWTHGRFVPVLLGLLLCTGLFWWDTLAPLYATFIAAGLVGWYTHLLLDGLLFRISPQDPF